MNPGDVRKSVERAAGQQAVEKPEIVNEKFLKSAGTDTKIRQQVADVRWTKMIVRRRLSSSYTGQNTWWPSGHVS